MKMVEVQHEKTGDTIRVPSCDTEQFASKGWLPKEQKVNKKAKIEELETE